MLNALVTLPQHPGHDDQEHERDPQHQQPELQRSVSAQLDSSQAPARSAILLGRSHACVEEQQRPLSAHAFSVDGRQTTVNGRVARILFVAVSRAAAIVLLALLVALPAMDAVSCPDGCTDAVHAHASLETVVHASGACGFCLNALAVHADWPILVSITRLAVLFAVPASHASSLAPPSIDRPPRRA